MKKLLVFILPFVCFSAFAIPLQVTSPKGQESDEKLIQLKTQLSWNQEKNQMSLLGFAQTHQVGAVKVPFYTIYLLGKQQILSQIDYGKPEIYPAKVLSKAIDKGCRCPGARTIPLIPKIQPVKDHWEYLGGFQGQPLYRFLLYPVEYDAQTATAKYYPQMRLHVKSIQEGLHLPKIFFHWSELANYIHQQTPKTLLLVTPQKYHSTLRTYEAWKRKQGYKVSYFFSDNMSNDAEEIKAEINRGRNLSQFGYVIFVGHEHNFPTFYKPTSTDMDTPTDLPYFINEDGDFIADANYGRFPVENEEDLKGIIQKILLFESTPYNTNTQNISMLGLASNEGHSPSDWEYLQDIQKKFRQVFPFKMENFHQDNPEETPEMINRKLEQGLFWITYIGHGSGYSWDSFYQESYHQTHLDRIQNMDSFPIVLDISCQNGRFPNDHHLGEKFINLKSSKIPYLPLGAVAYYGGSVNITWDPPALMGMGIAAFARSGIPLGAILKAGQLSLYSQLEMKNSIEENLLWYHLLGDPTLRLP